MQGLHLFATWKPGAEQLAGFKKGLEGQAQNEYQPFRQVSDIIAV
jgi:hypothetical protein